MGNKVLNVWIKEDDPDEAVDVRIIEMEEDDIILVGRGTKKKDIRYHLSIDGECVDVHSKSFNEAKKLAIELNCASEDSIWV